MEIEKRLMRKKLVRDQSARSLTSLGHYKILVRHDSVRRPNRRASDQNCTVDNGEVA